MSGISEGEIEPCPFCGSDNVEVSEGHNPYICFVTCNECWVDGPHCKAVGMAKETWNDRANTESEDDECERCSDVGFVGDGGGTPIPCPDCHEDADSAENAQTEDEEIFEKTYNDPVSKKSYNEPKPGDEEWRELLYLMINPITGVSKNSNRLGLEETQSHHALRCVLDYIDDLEQELEEVRLDRRVPGEIEAYRKSNDRRRL